MGPYRSWRTTLPVMEARETTLPMKESDGDEPVDTMSSVLANQQRRYLLYCLSVYANPMRLPDIADQLTIWTGSNPADEEYSKERLHVYDSLYYNHLPVLREAGLVEYHEDEDMVELGSAMPAIKATLKPYFAREINDLLEAEGQSMTHEDT